MIPTWYKKYQQYDLQHFQRLSEYTKMIEGLYKQASQDATALLSTGMFQVDDSKIFSMSDYPGAKDRFDKIMGQVHTGITGTVTNGIEAEWLMSAKKNDFLVKSILGTSGLKPEQLSGFMDRNTKALAAFQQRKINGMGLSKKVWAYTKQFQGEMEMALDLGLGSGKSAHELALEVQRLLKSPDDLFRRVREKHGNLKLSQRAAAYSPGPGVYRSSYKNAMRVTRTEINMAYRTSDHERWQQLPFISGFEVRLSNSHPVTDICDDLKGKYPKEFLFRGWHPQCLCHVVSLLATEDEVEQMTREILNGRPPESIIPKGKIDEVPEGFINWITKNQDRIEGMKSKPYFILDNSPGGELGKWIKSSVSFVKADAIPIEIPFMRDVIDYVEEKSTEYGQDIFMKPLYKKQGFDGLPKVVSKETVDEAIGNGGIELYRGIPSQYVDQFKYGELYAGEGIHGNGIYAASGNAAFDVAYKYANSGYNQGNAPGSGVMRMAIRKEAKGIGESELMDEFMNNNKYSALRDELKAYEQDFVLQKYAPEAAKNLPPPMPGLESVDDIKKATKFCEKVADDPGRYALAQGYDYIMTEKLRDFNRGGKMPMLTTEVIVLNRTILYVEL